MEPMDHSPSISRRVRSTLAGQDGIALLMVLVVITVLATLVVSFTDTTQKHLQVTQYYKNRLKAYWAAQSGLQAAVGLLRASAMAPQTGADGATSPWNYESDVYQQTVPLLLSTIFCESSMLEPALLLTETYSRATDLGLSRTPAAVPILDENRKLSIFGLVTNPGTTQERTEPAVFQRLAYLLQYLLREADFATGEEAQNTGTMSFGLQEETKIGMDRARTLAGYLVDWMDTENSTTADVMYNSDTAEQTCPEDGLPYEAKNGRLDSIDEIGLVCGFRQLPHTTIQRLTRHLTAYNLTTNINTASLPVLHAFCAAALGDGMENETESEKIYPLLHYDGDQETAHVLGSKDYGSLLSLATSYSQLITYLQDNTDTTSTIFQVAVYGLVLETETGTVLARCRLQMDLQRREEGNQFDPLYYRED